MKPETALVPTQQNNMAPPLAAPGVLTGTMKAALWLLSSDEDTAVQTLALLSGPEVVRLRQAVEHVRNVKPEELTGVHNEFQRILEEQPLRLRGSIDYLEKITSRALGENRAAALMAPGDQLPAVENLHAADVNALSALLSEEHPQVVAAVLATLPAPRASDILLHLPEAMRLQVVERLARLCKVPHASLSRVQQILAAGLPAVGDHDYEVDGIRLAASLLNQLEKQQADGILKGISDTAEPLASEVRQAMFTFEDLEALDRRGMQSLLKEVPSEQLMLALKAASEKMKTLVFGALSKRAAEMMQEDMSLAPPARLVDVEKAQNEVVELALRLRDEGKITIVGQGADFV